MTIAIALLLLGFVSLIKGADWLVDGASTLARKHRISELAIGLTIVAFGTSAPEMVVNTFAAYQGSSDIVFGNVIGSNNFNLFAILGIVGLIAPLVVQSSTVWKEIPISFFAAVLLFGLCNDSFFGREDVLSRWDALILLVFFCLFLYYVYTQMRGDGGQPVSVPGTPESSTLKIWGLILLGLGGLIIGGKLVVNSAVDIATALGVSQKIIGLTIVAAGTSLPELVTSVVAARRKNTDIAIGNIIGYNIFNILFVLSVSSFVKPVAYSTAFNTDLYLFGGGTVLLFVAMFTGGKKKLDRWEAGILLAVYVIYTTWLIVRG